MEQHNASAKNTGSILADGILLIRDYSAVEMSIDSLTYCNAKNEEELLPKMIPVVKKFLCVPATSATRDFAFGSG
jgi:hypothetical protein